MCDRMVDRLKVISDLEEQIAWIRDNDFHKFPGWGHAVLAMRDALALLKAQEPRVIKFEELVAWQKQPITARDPIYVEYREGKGFGAPHWAQDNFGFNVASCSDNYRSGAYGMLIRCWTSRPTDAQREATPWN